MFKRATVDDINDNKFRKQPKALDGNEYYKDLSISAKYLYGIMLDRFSLSKSKNWVNKNNEIYFIFKQKDLSELMNISVSSIKRYIEELIEYQLIQKEYSMTVNLYFITLEYQQWFKLNPGIAKSEPTSDHGRSNYKETYCNKTKSNKKEYYTVAKATEKVKEFVKIYEETFKIPYRKITIDEFTHDDIISLDIYDFSIRVNEFFKLMGYDKNKCTLEYINKTFSRLL